MTDMADVLRAHWFTAIDYAYCLCGADLGYKVGHNHGFVKGLEHARERTRNDGS